MPSFPSTAWEVLDAAAAGSAEARDEFARRYGEFIRHQLAARWRGTSMLAAIDDAWQEVFVECLKPGGVLVRANRSAPEGFRALLGAVVRNVALRAETARHRAQPLASDVSATVLLAPVSSVGRTLDRSYAQELLRAAAAEQARRAETVGDGARRRVELLRMHFEEGRTIPEIAAVWERDASYVHHQYAKARADFERALRAVLVARFPELADGDLRARCLELVQLLRSG